MRALWVSCVTYSKLFILLVHLQHVCGRRIRVEGGRGARGGPAGGPRDPRGTGMPLRPRHPLLPLEELYHPVRQRPFGELWDAEVLSPEDGPAEPAILLCDHVEKTSAEVVINVCGPGIINMLCTSMGRTRNSSWTRSCLLCLGRVCLLLCLGREGSDFLS